MAKTLKNVSKIKSGTVNQNKYLSQLKLEYPSPEAECIKGAKN